MLDVISELLDGGVGIFAWIWFVSFGGMFLKVVRGVAGGWLF